MHELFDIILKDGEEQIRSNLEATLFEFSLHSQQLLKIVL
jgi:hypothetical protein